MFRRQRNSGRPRYAKLWRPDRVVVGLRRLFGNPVVTDTVVDTGYLLPPFNLLSLLIILCFRDQLKKKNITMSIISRLVLPVTTVVTWRPRSPVFNRTDVWKDRPLANTHLKPTEIAGLEVFDDCERTFDLVFFFIYFVLFADNQKWEKINRNRVPFRWFLLILNKSQ